jgi:hypothetical protein
VRAETFHHDTETEVDPEVQRDKTGAREARAVVELKESVQVERKPVKHLLIISKKEK